MARIREIAGRCFEPVMAVGGVFVVAVMGCYLAAAGGVDLVRDLIDERH